MMTPRVQRQASRVAVFVVLSLVGVVMLFPFVFMAITAFRSFDQYIAGSGFSLDSWKVLFDAIPVLQQLLNSTIVTGGAVLIILAVSSTGGYALAKLGFRGSSYLFLGVLAGMTVPMQSIIIPEFVNVSQVGLINQYLGAILVYAALGVPFATFLMTAYYRGIPNELVEASLMDGASFWQIFLRVMLPMGVPALVTVGVLQVIQIWDDLLIGLLFLQSPGVRTITVGLATLQSSRMVDVPALMAGSILSAVPAIVVYLIFQRNLVAGLTMGVNK
jgi:multiple sugar transport system permease protein/raffinose/stachyose/melibiose transport system permease protein